MAARCMVALGRPDDAVAALAGVLDRYDPNRARELALYTSTLAEAHLDAGNLDQAAAAALRTAELARRTSSSRSEARVDVLVGRLRAFNRKPLVRDFLDEACALPGAAAGLHSA